MEKQTLDDLVKASIESAIASESIAKKVQSAADKAVSDAIDSAFGYGSPFRKQVEESIKKVLPVVNVDDLSSFANSVRILLQKRLANLASETARQHLDSVLDKILPESRVITMAELRNAYVEKIREKLSRADCTCEESSEDPDFVWNVEHSTGSTSQYWDLWMSPDPDASRYGGKETVILRLRPSAANPGLHECWHVSAGGSDIHVNSLFAGPLYGFDAMVFRLATGTALLNA